MHVNVNLFVLTATWLAGWQLLFCLVKVIPLLQCSLQRGVGHLKGHSANGFRSAREPRVITMVAINTLTEITMIVMMTMTCDHDQHSHQNHHHRHPYRHSIIGSQP